MISQFPDGISIPDKASSFARMNELISAKDMETKSLLSVMSGSGKSVASGYVEGRLFDRRSVHRVSSG
jgi:hypothetical protein